MPIWASGRRGRSCERRIGGESDHFDTELVPVECDDTAMKTHFGWTQPADHLGRPVCGRVTGTRSPGTCVEGQWRGAALLEHEGKDDGDHEDALNRVHDDPHPCALEAPRRVGLEKDALHQGGRHDPRHMQVIEGEQHSRWRPSRPAEDGSHPRQQQPRKSSSSPSTVLKRTNTTMSANQPQAPLKKAAPRSEPRKSPKSLPEGPGIAGTIDHTATRATRSSAHHHTLPPTRPVFGFAVAGAKVHRAPATIPVTPAPA